MFGVDDGKVRWPNSLAKVGVKRMIYGCVINEDVLN